MDATPEVTDAEDAGRYELRLGDELVGHIAYRVDPEGRYVFVHTEVDPGHQGQGLAEVLVRRALEHARANGRQVIAQCPYVRKFVHGHDGWDDVVVGELGPSEG